VAELDAGLQAKLLRALQEKRFHRVGGSQEIRSDFRVVSASHRDLASQAAEGRFREDLYFRLAVFELEIPALREREGDIEILANHFLKQHGDGAQPRLGEEAKQLLNSYPFPGNVRELENAIQRAVVVCRDGMVSPVDLPARIRRGADNDVLPLSPVEKGTAEIPGIPRSSPRRLEDMEKRALVSALSAAEGNVAEAARQLGIGRTTIYRKMKKFSLDSK